MFLHMSGFLTSDRLAGFSLADYAPPAVPFQKKRTKDGDTGEEPGSIGEEGRVRLLPRALSTRLARTPMSHSSALRHLLLCEAGFRNRAFVS